MEERLEGGRNESSQTRCKEWMVVMVIVVLVEVGGNSKQ